MCNRNRPQPWSGDAAPFKSVKAGIYAYNLSTLCTVLEVKKVIKLSMNCLVSNTYRWYSKAGHSESGTALAAPLMPCMFTVFQSGFLPGKNLCAPRFS